MKVLCLCKRLIPHKTIVGCLDDQPEVSEYIRYQRTIRELKDENSHLRDEMTNLRKSLKSQQPDKKQVYTKTHSRYSLKQNTFLI